MRKLMIFMFTLMTCLTGHAFDVQFVGGNQIEIETREGYVTERCFEGSEIRLNSYSCSDSSLSIGSYGAIEVLKESIDADWVKLQRVGSKYIKGVKFDSTTGRSSYRINLWIGSLFQRPLLVEGENRIKYIFTKKKKIVAEGEFIASVNQGLTLSCRNGFLLSNYCRSYNPTCEEYLYRTNYCR